MLEIYPKAHLGAAALITHAERVSHQNPTEKWNALFIVDNHNIFANGSSNTRLNSGRAWTGYTGEASGMRLRLPMIYRGGDKYTYVSRSQSNKPFSCIEGRQKCPPRRVMYMYDDDGGRARSSDPLTSHEALGDEELRTRISDEIDRVAREAGLAGVTINETAEALPKYKPWSISPMFKPLVCRGVLVRRLVGVTEPSSRFPEGKEIYETRVDAVTHKHCIVHYHHSVFKKPSSSAPAQKRLEYGD